MNNPLAHVTSFLQFPVTIRRLYLYLSLNNHASLEMPIKRVRELGLIRVQSLQYVYTKTYSRFFYDPYLRIGPQVWVRGEYKFWARFYH
jgi:hypothetical protein